MTILVSGTLEEVRQRVAAAASGAGWALEPATADAPARLRPSDAGEEHCGWVHLTLRGDRVAVTAWLPDEGPAAPREALETALDQLVEAGQAPADAALLRRLRRIEGQIRGLQRMIEGERECEAVLTQFAAVNAALKQTAAHLVSSHLVECVREELAQGGEPAQINQRLLNILF